MKTLSNFQFFFKKYISWIVSLWVSLRHFPVFPFCWGAEVSLSLLTASKPVGVAAGKCWVQHYNICQHQYENLYNSNADNWLRFCYWVEVAVVLVYFLPLGLSLLHCWNTCCIYYQSLHISKGILGADLQYQKSKNYFRTIVIRDCRGTLKNFNIR